VPILHVEHAISDFDTWQHAFDSDPVRREEFGVRRDRVLRPIDDPRYVVLDLEFDTRGDAQAFHVRRPARARHRRRLGL
jgi:hypothetical protein